MPQQQTKPKTTRIGFPCNIINKFGFYLNTFVLLCLIIVFSVIINNNNKKNIKNNGPIIILVSLIFAFGLNLFFYLYYTLLFCIYLILSFLFNIFVMVSVDNFLKRIKTTGPPPTKTLPPLTTITPGSLI